MKIRRRAMAAGVPAVAMADIAFNLVLFFIMLAKTQDDKQIRWTPASSPTVQKAAITKVSLVVDADKKLYFNGRQIGISQLKDSVEYALRDAPAGKRGVLLKIHDQTPAQVFEPVVEAVSQAGGELMHILKKKQS
jgi:biopolymer transport protein ExbD